MTSSPTQAPQQPAVRESEFRRGLPALIFATLGAAFGYAALAYFVGVLVVPLGEEYGWSRGDVVQVNLWSGIGLAVLLPFTGALADKRGIRIVSFIAIPLFAVLILSLTFFDGALWMFLASYAVIGAVGSGTSAVVYAKVVSRCFDRHRGLALGILAAGLGSVGLVFPPMMGAIAEGFGWRATFLAMAVLAIVPLFGLIFAKIPAASERTATAPLRGMTPRAALGRREFWMLLAIFFLIGWALLSMVPHFIPMLIDSGVDPVTAALLSSLVGLGTVIARPILGWAFDRFNAIHVGVPLFVLAAIGCVVLLVGGAALAPLTALLIGIAFGAEIDLMSYLSSRYLGPRAFGRLYGAIYSCFTIGAALGPVTAGYLYAAQGSYSTSLVIAVIALVLGSAILLALPKYPRDAASE
ncbi:MULTISPECIES: MFS transporter [unclassified Microbacterium]|uniref:MFS transporter n=1 Tax=unclassified Microbacterium TaxID=2609290 RepID=UPI00097E97AB|nr:MFS transporter [Microbacterium sp. JB110]RCS57258.1 MFS transporter [Microbacterium sp. JB110]SJM58866.1 Major facilitator superfamily MFS_1 [Frigoribacterium sp. JB110]